MRQHKRYWMAIGIAVAFSAQAQTRISLKSQGKEVDFSGVASTKPMKSGFALPLTCSPGEVFFHLGAQLRIPSDADQRSELMPIAIPKSCRSPFQSDGDQRSKLMPITRLI